MIRGDVDSLMTLIEALDIAGIELIGEAAAGRAQRPRHAVRGVA